MGLPDPNRQATSIRFDKDKLAEMKRMCKERNLTFQGEAEQAIYERFFGLKERPRTELIQAANVRILKQKIETFAAGAIDALDRLNSERGSGPEMAKAKKKGARRRK